METAKPAVDADTLPPHGYQELTRPTAENRDTSEVSLLPNVPVSRKTNLKQAPVFDKQCKWLQAREETSFPVWEVQVSNER